MTRVGVFIDGLNVRFRLKECGWCEFYDVGYLVRQLVGPRQLEAAFYFHPQPNQEHLGQARYGQERAYLSRVQKDDVVAVPEGAYMAKRERQIEDKRLDYWIEKQTDVLLATHMVYYAATGLIEVAVVVSADADIAPAMRWCRDLEVPVELVRFRGSIPRLYELERYATHFRRARPAFFRPYDSD